ncbi:hypothetical protein O6H91_08G047700 [Diphasiastrum complanatum]|uniref:Uncharacterized protein n=2 Tax=Diphasiastrum complanatum TaxID=34168 RepID=A0ACC2CX56_DIPCM|nr:hypothetical protein O6H91_08G047700 [Diphasiastrum complanatum]KAJ7546631.1 hypothetical protein O6H91_08G047700 [Diphasiastrum complanatum]
MTGRRVHQERGAFDLLDDYTLLNILERLQDSFDRQAWCLVCKHFLHLEVSCRKRIQLLRSEVLEQVLQRYTNLQHLDLSLCIRVTDRSLLSVAKFLGVRLLSINLSKIGGFSDTGLAYLARECPSLVEVDLSYCSNLGDLGVISLAQLSNLQSLQLMGCHSITDAGLGCLAAGCKNLCVLNLKGCLGITDAGIAFIAANCKLLHTLDLSYTEVTDKGLASITILDSLKDLNLVACNNVDDTGLEHLRNSCKTLLRLDVSRCQNVSDAGITALADGPVALQQITLSYCSQITDEVLATFQKFDCLQTIKLDGCEIAGKGLLFIGKGCKQLRELSLSKSRGVSDLGIAAVASGCTGLHKVDLTCCRDLSDVVLASLATSCKGLIALKMEGCELITEKGLALLGEGCSSLEELDFTDSSINDLGLKAISRCSALRILKLGFCYNISDQGLRHIGASCYNLRDLDLYRSREIGDGGVAAVSCGCQRLKGMNLSYCPKVTDASLQSISQLRELRQLEVRGCALVTSLGLSIVAAGCKRLLELDIKRCTRIDDVGVLAVARSCPNIRMINLSYCPVSNNGLMSVAKLSCMQNMKLVHLKNVSGECFAAALLACGSLKKVKLVSYLRMVLPAGLIEEMEIRGCKMRWMEKPW